MKKFRIKACKIDENYYIYYIIFNSIGEFFGNVDCYLPLPSPNNYSRLPYFDTNKAKDESQNVPARIT